MSHYKVMLTLRTPYVSGVEGVLAVDPSKKNLMKKITSRIPVKMSF